ITAGKYFNVAEKNIKAAIENYIPSNSRSQLTQMGSNKIILDAYNANPSSMKLAIENFAKNSAPDKVLILGAMAELGKESITEHQNIIDLINQFSWKAVVLVGGDFLNTEHSYQKFETSHQAKEWLRNKHFENTYLLIKDSLSLLMEKLILSLNMMYEK